MQQLALQQRFLLRARREPTRRLSQSLVALEKLTGREKSMEQLLINLVAGAIGGNAAGKASSTFDLGTLDNTIAGLVGGGVLGQIIALVWPSVVASLQSGNFNVGSIVTQAIGGGAGGAILTAIVGAIKNKAAA
jgi:hypothetical protein